MADDFMSDEDKALFRDHMRSVKPLSEKSKRINTPATVPPVIPVKPKKVHQPRPIIKKEYFLSDYIKETVLSNTMLSYSAPGIPNKRFRAFKNGQIPWEAKLDLHGLTSEAAREALSQFIQTQTNTHKRCLLIVHGKGGHQLDAPPIIKNLINRWLPQFDEVIAFHSALPKDGGHGAVYVLLKRNRED
jgi:DNA-nicking Smr family endonuclease